MKNIFGKFLLIVSALGLPTSQAQAQAWTDASGTPIPIGTEIVFAGYMDISLFGWLSRKTCNVSIVGTVKDSSISDNKIEFLRSTPGFVSNCDMENEGYIDFPIDAEPMLVGSPTGRSALVLNLTFNTPIGTCSHPAIYFPWYNATVSQVNLASTVTATPCVLHSGSRLWATGAWAGNVSIN